MGVITERLVELVLEMKTVWRVESDTMGMSKMLNNTPFFLLLEKVTEIINSMTTLHNEIIIDAPMEKIWASLSNMEELDRYDPAVKKSVALTEAKSGHGASRRVEMKDGKNWFEERVTKWVPDEALTFELTACSFPIQGLSHTYSFELVGKRFKVKQVMEYRVKYGLLGWILDRLMIKKQSDAGIKKFMTGLKSYAEAK